MGGMAQASHQSSGVGPDDLEVGMYVQLGPWKTQIVSLGVVAVQVRGNIGDITENQVTTTNEYACDHLIRFGGGV